jgi:PPOX class probable F420-dependent enzyme
VRPLDDTEIASLLAGDVVAHLATLDAAGYPHVTPIWFLWAEGVFRLTSYPGRPHLERIAADPRVGLVIDTEAAERPDGERPNRQVRIVGDATVTEDIDQKWTQRIRAKYLAHAPVHSRPSAERMVITVRPRRMYAVASV